MSFKDTGLRYDFRVPFLTDWIDERSRREENEEYVKMIMRRGEYDWSCYGKRWNSKGDCSFCPREMYCLTAYNTFSNARHENQSKQEPSGFQALRGSFVGAIVGLIFGAICFYILAYFALGIIGFVGGIVFVVLFVIIGCLGIKGTIIFFALLLIIIKIKKQ